MSADPTAEHIDAAPAFSKFLTERLEDPAVRAAYEASKARDQVPLTTQAPAPVDSDYDRARYALSALRTEAGFVLGDVIARLVLDSGAVTPSTDPAALAASLPAEAMLAALVDRGALTEEPWRVKCLCGKTLEGSPDEVSAWTRAHDDSPKASHIVVWYPPSGKPWTRRHVTRGEVAP